MAHGHMVTPGTPDREPVDLAWMLGFWPRCQGSGLDARVLAQIQLG